MCMLLNLWPKSRSALGLLIGNKTRDTARNTDQKPDTFLVDRTVYCCSRLLVSIAYTRCLRIYVQTVFARVCTFFVWSVVSIIWPPIIGIPQQLSPGHHVAKPQFLKPCALTSCIYGLNCFSQLYEQLEVLTSPVYDSSRKQKQMSLLLPRGGDLGTIRLHRQFDDREIFCRWMRPFEKKQHIEWRLWILVFSCVFEFRAIIIASVSGLSFSYVFWRLRVLIFISFWFLFRFRGISSWDFRQRNPARCDATQMSVHGPGRIAINVSTS